MRIIQLIQKPQLRGAELFACQLSDHLIKNGHEVKIICLLPGEANLPFSGEIIKLNRPLSKRFIDLKGWKMLAEEISTFRPDIIQANAGDTLKFAVLSKLINRWKTPVVFRNANKVSDFITSAPKLWLNKLLVSRVTHVISVSELCKQDFIKCYSFPTDKISMVQIGIEIRPIDAKLPEDLISFFANSKVIINVGSLVPEKNQLRLIEMMKSLVKVNPLVKLILVGDGKQRQLVKEKIESEHLTSNILMAGYRTDVLSILSNTHAMAMPSLIEGLPGVILEAQYCGVPVVAYDVGGISEVIRNDQTGWLVNKNDEAGFIKGIEAVLNEENTRQIVDNAKKQVTGEFDNRQIAKRFLKVYESVVKNAK